MSISTGHEWVTQGERWGAFSSFDLNLIPSLELIKMNGWSRPRNEDHPLRKSVVALAGYNIHSSAIVVFHSPPTLVLEGRECWKGGGWGVRRPLLWSQLCRHTDVSIPCFFH